MWERFKELTLETSVHVTGEVRAEPRAPGGFEMGVAGLDRSSARARSTIRFSRRSTASTSCSTTGTSGFAATAQRAIFAIRNEIEQAIHDFFYERGFLRVDTPILTAAIGERSGLFSTEYFDEGNAYLAQTGQLYGEAAAAAFGKIYTFGPTFRAEKSKTRRHLTEFWMIEPEVAWNDSADNMRLQEDFVVVSRAARASSDARAELKELERDTAQLETREAAVPSRRLHRRGRDPAEEGKRRSSGATTSAPRTRRCSSPTTTGRCS